MAADKGTTVSKILVTEVVYGSSDEKRGTLQRGIPTENADFTEVSSEDAKANDGVNAKITYYDKPTVIIYVEDTVATLVAKANGNVSASS